MFKDALATLGMGIGLVTQPSAPAMPTEDLQLGNGPVIAVGQRVTVHFIVADGSGNELANSKKRGLAYTFSFEEGSTNLFGKIVPGMKVGGQRRVHMSADQGYGAAGLPPIVPANQPLVVVVTVVKAG